MLSICSEDKKHVTYENAILVTNVNSALAKYRESLRNFALEIEELADQYDSVWKKHKAIRVGGYSGSVLGCLLGIGGGIVSVATAGAAVPFLVGGLFVAGAVAGVGGGITRWDNARTTKNRLEELSETFEDLLESTMHSHESLVDALREFQGAPQLQALKMETMIGEKVQIFQGSGKAMINILHAFPSFKTLVKTGLINTFKQKAAGSASMAASSVGLTDDVLVGGARATGQTVATEGIKRAAIAAGGVAIGLGVLALGYEIYEIVQDVKKDDCTFSQELRNLAANIRENHLIMKAWGS
ncbi:hypothetical protein TCAL_13195 [Tigriopus californicus]|uniref:Uncharacterized protein n=1 Tax=Tigriopus californicus TaxID=6832 RepID=A0A553PLX6_TIGCA|nr:uncharacterized protein LOC131891079 [Tigriopus californicus]TRY78676.1 hypothetical protein TCAL_13195 [Tigriopus californicus]|eukprot:TCALIF_13195-PA protein Name:"Protein of unknown function" AED:0.00 eAED:0.00 QI:72/1/1/1/0/0.5/2/133/298